MIMHDELPFVPRDVVDYLKAIYTPDFFINADKCFICWFAVLVIMTPPVSYFFPVYGIVPPEWKIQK